MRTRCVKRHIGESFTIVGWPRPEPQAPGGTRSQHVLAASGARNLARTRALSAVTHSMLESVHAPRFLSLCSIVPWTLFFITGRTPRSMGGEGGVS